MKKKLLIFLFVFSCLTGSNAKETVQNIFKVVSSSTQTSTPYTPGGNPQYLKSVTNSAGQSQGGYYILTSDMPLYEPTSRDSSIICKVDPQSYFTPSELASTPRAPQNLKDILPLLKCSLDGTTCPTDLNCAITGGIAASCSFKNDTLITIPESGKSIDFYSTSTNAKDDITSLRADPTVFYSTVYNATSRPKTLIFVPKARFATDPIIMISRDKNGNFYTAAFLLKENIAGGATNDGVYYPADTTLDNNYLSLGTNGAELNLEIKPMQKTIEGTTYTFDYAPILSSGSQTTATNQTKAIWETTGYG